MSLQQFVFHRIDGCSGSRLEVELGEDVVEVPRNRLLADVEFGADAAIAFAGCNQPQDLDLAGG